MRKQPSSVTTKVLNNFEIFVIATVSLICLIVTAFLLFSLEVSEKYRFWKSAAGGTCIFLLCALVVLIFMWVRWILGQQIYDSVEFTDFINHKVDQNKVKFEETNGNLVEPCEAMLSYLKNANNWSFEDLIVYKLERLERMNQRKKEMRYLRLDYLEKYRKSKVYSYNRRSVRNNSFSRRSSITLDSGKEKVAPKRITTLNNIMQIEEISEEESLKSMELDQLSDSNTSKESSEEDLEFSDDKINEIFGLGKYSKSRMLREEDSSTREKQGEIQSPRKVKVIKFKRNITE